LEASYATTAAKARSYAVNASPSILVYAEEFRCEGLRGITDVTVTVTVTAIAAVAAAALFVVAAAFAAATSTAFAATRLALAVSDRVHFKSKKLLIILAPPSGATLGKAQQQRQQPWGGAASRAPTCHPSWARSCSHPVTQNLSKMITATPPMMKPKISQTQAVSFSLTRQTSTDFQ
jgi:hypothetical protein